MLYNADHVLNIDISDKVLATRKSKRNFRSSKVMILRYTHICNIFYNTTWKLQGYFESECYKNLQITKLVCFELKFSGKWPMGHIAYVMVTLYPFLYLLSYNLNSFPGPWKWDAWFKQIGIFIILSKRFLKSYLYLTYLCFEMCIPSFGHIFYMVTTYANLSLH